MTNAIHTGVLRDIVKDRAALGEHWIPVPVLLRRLQLDQRLEEIQARLRDARSALKEGDDAWADIELDFVDGILRRLLDR